MSIFRTGAFGRRMAGLVASGRRALGGLAIALVASLAAPSGALAACQTSVDFTGAAINDTRTLDVSTCAAGLRAGLYLFNGVDTSKALPLQADASLNHDGNPLAIIPQTVNLGGPTVQITPVTTDGYNSFSSYIFKLIAAGPTSSGGQTFFYANTSCPVTISGCGSQTFGTTNASTTINVTGAPLSAGPATHFSVSAPASATAGTSFNVTVTALDSSNATATGYAGTVQFTSTDGAATLPANSTLTNGVGTFPSR